MNKHDPQLHRYGTAVTERRLDRPLIVLRLIAVACALFAALGIAHGIHAGNPSDGWFLPVVAGVVAAAGFAGAWHVLIGVVTGMVRPTMLAGFFLAGLFITAIAVGASAQAIATALAGNSALSAELSTKVEDYNQALAEAHREGTRWSSLPGAALALSAGFKGQAESEASGFNGASGKGPRYAKLIDISNSFNAVAAQLSAKLADADATRDAGNDALAIMRDAAARADQTAFMEGAEGVTRAIATLNGVDPMAIVGSVGVVDVSETGFDVNDKTAAFHADAEQALDGRVQIDAPTFVPLSLGEATRRQMFGSAMHGWILAGAIDLLPFIFLFIAFVMSREVWMNGDVKRNRMVAQDRDERDRAVLDSMHGNSRRDDDRNEPRA